LPSISRRQSSGSHGSEHTKAYDRIDVSKVEHG
jgi:hypothetical protein